MNPFKRQSRKSLLELTANQAMEISDQKELIASQNVELANLRYDLMLLTRENRKLKRRAEAMTPIKERMCNSEKARKPENHS